MFLRGQPEIRFSTRIDEANETYAQDGEADARCTTDPIRVGSQVDDDRRGAGVRTQNRVRLFYSIAMSDEL